MDRNTTPVELVRSLPNTYRGTSSSPGDRDRVTSNGGRFTLPEGMVRSPLRSTVTEVSHLGSYTTVGVNGDSGGRKPRNSREGQRTKLLRSVTPFPGTSEVLRRSPRDTLSSPVFSLLSTNHQ